MRASVIVVSHNSASYLPACLRSILAGITPHDEVIVVDNASTDGSADLVRAQFPQVRLVCGPNDGYAGGNNRGAAHARGDYLVFLNPDTVVEPGAIDALVAPLVQQGTGIGVTTACVVLLDRPDMINTCGLTIHYTGLGYCRGAGQRRDQWMHAGEVDAVSGAACAIRRTVFEEVGGFDANFWMYVEDTDLSWRVRLAGYRCWYVPGAVVRHDYRPRYSPRKAFYLERNRYLLMLKCLQWSTLWRMLPGLVISEWIMWCFLLAKGPRYWAVKLRAYRCVLRERTTIGAARQDVQSRRRQGDHVLMQRLTHRLEFNQFAQHWVGRVAAWVFDPVLWAAQRCVVFAVPTTAPRSAGDRAKEIV